MLEKETKKLEYLMPESWRDTGLTLRFRLTAEGERERMELTSSGLAIWSAFVPASFQGPKYLQSGSAGLSRLKCN